MPTQKKQVTVDDLASKLAEAKILILTSSSGLPVSQLQDIRRSCKKENIEYHVVKNTLAKLAAKKAGISLDLDAVLSTSSAIAFGMGDEISAAKLVSNYAKSIEAFTIKGGVFENKLLSAEQIVSLATLPSREQLLAQIMGGLQSPLRKLMYGLQDKQRSLLYALKSLAEQKATA